jgi:hypothetical protein
VDADTGKGGRVLSAAVPGARWTGAVQYGDNNWSTILLGMVRTDTSRFSSLVKKRHS